MGKLASMGCFIQGYLEVISEIGIYFMFSLSGRKITPKGQKDLDQIAGQVRASVCSVTLSC